MTILFGLKFEPLSRREQIAKAFKLAFDDRRCHLLVTPNMDHIVKLRFDVEFRSAYQCSSLIVVDGWPLSFMAKLLRRNIGDRNPGSDFVPALFDYADSLNEPLRIMLIGSPPGVNEIASKVIVSRWKHVQICGHICPPKGFLSFEFYLQAIVDYINNESPNVIVLGLGAPTQEILFYRLKDRIERGLFVGAGATMEFIAGTKSRAPRFLRILRLEWLYRLLQEPRRLVRRYFLCAIYLPIIFLEEMLTIVRARNRDLS